MLKIGSNSPWGKIDYIDQKHPEIIQVGTPSHGGFKVYARLNKQIPESFRSENGWYEEDSAADIVFFFLGHLFCSDDLVAKAEVGLKRWYWKEYEAHFQTEVSLAESDLKAMELKKRENRTNFIVKSAFGSWHEEVPAGKVGVFAVRESDKAEGWFMVDESEYGSGSVFVIDESRHEKWDTKLNQKTKQVA